MTWVKVWFEDGFYKEIGIQNGQEHDFDTEIKKHGNITDIVIYSDC